MFNIAIQNYDNEITVVVRVNDIKYILLAQDDSRYKWSGLDVELYDVNISCTGLQSDKNNTFPVSLYFTGAITSAGIDDIKECYEIGKLIKVKGSFHIFYENNNWCVMIQDVIAIWLPKVTVEFFEKTMEESYLPQRTVESLYAMPYD